MALPRKRGGHGAWANRRAADLYAYEIAPIIAELKASGIVLPRAIADELRKRRAPTARGGAWHPPPLRACFRVYADPLALTIEVLPPTF
jgi:hypothetical protein